MATQNKVHFAAARANCPRAYLHIFDAAHARALHRYKCKIEAAKRAFALTLRAIDAEHSGDRNKFVSQAMLEKMTLAEYMMIAMFREAGAEYDLSHSECLRAACDAEYIDLTYVADHLASQQNV